MRNIVICCDGTWNNPKQEDNGVPAPTNVVRLFNALAQHDDQGGAQLKYYHPGLGGEEMGLKEKILGGALGIGITRHICSAYHWLGNQYEEGDNVYIFGFSRGAFTARCLAGMLGKGLLSLRGITPKQSWKRVEKAFKSGYRSGNKNWRNKDWKAFNRGYGLKVNFLGVWDTVGALGIPDDLEILNLFDNPDNWRFHDSKLGKNVLSGRHAMALDELRSSFTVTHWSNIDSHDDAVELWFPGVHSDVGGGYAETDLSNGALTWMIEEATSAGLVFRPNVLSQINSNPKGVLHNSYKGLFAKLRSRPRCIPAVSAQNASLFHTSILERQMHSPLEYPEYHPTRTLEVDESITIPIFADTRWNNTNLYLRKGEKFIFSAHGEWQDSKDTCDWKGTEDEKLTFGDIVRGVSTFLGKLENLYKSAANNQSTDFLGTKRVENLKWFTMVGAIANDSGKEESVGNDGSPVSHQYISLVEHENAPFEVKIPGYFYAFPNDVWSLYENNHGSIDLKIKRVE